MRKSKLFVPALLALSVACSNDDDPNGEGYKWRMTMVESGNVYYEDPDGPPAATRPLWKLDGPIRVEHCLCAADHVIMELGTSPAGLPPGGGWSRYLEIKTAMKTQLELRCDDIAMDWAGDLYINDDCTYAQSSENELIYRERCVPDNACPTYATGGWSPTGGDNDDGQTSVSPTGGWPSASSSGN